MDKIIDKRGYLNKDYMLFHLSDRRSDEHTFHFHEFDKIVVLLSGKASYIIEGREYFLHPGDILLVNHHDIHMPIIDNSEDYSRIVIWINRDFITTHSTEDIDLSLAFRITRERNMCLIPGSSSGVVSLLGELEEAIHSDGFGASLMSDACMIRLLVSINRLAIAHTDYVEDELCRYDAKIADVLRYINSHLSDSLTLDNLASEFYMSKSYLMHRFKSETGYTLHNYILQKRLLYSRVLISQGYTVTDAALSSGFSDYSTYIRAFKRQFNCLPKDF